MQRIALASAGLSFAVSGSLYAVYAVDANSYFARPGQGSSKERSFWLISSTLTSSAGKDRGRRSGGFFADRRVPISNTIFVDEVRSIQLLLALVETSEARPPRLHVFQRERSRSAVGDPTTYARDRAERYDTQ